MTGGRVMIHFHDIRNSDEVNQCIIRADKALEITNFTEHGHNHINYVVKEASRLLNGLNYDERTIELTQIAAYMHDIGNLINRKDHAQSGALLAYDILTRMDMDIDEKLLVVNAIGNHDELTAETVSDIASALIIADKCDVRRSRVRKRDPMDYNIHNEVNYAVMKHSTNLSLNDKEYTLHLCIDTNICNVSDFFEIFLKRMKLCKRACETLGLQFHLIINHQLLL